MYFIGKLWKQIFESFKIFFNSTKSVFLRINGIFKKIAITEEEVEGEGEGIIQIEEVKTGEEVTLTEKEEEVEEKVEVDSSNDDGEILEVKSDKCTASPSKSKNVLSHLQKRINVLLQNWINFLSYLHKKCTASPLKSDKCTTSPSKSNKCTSLQSNKYTTSHTIINKCTSSK